MAVTGALTASAPAAFSPRLAPLPMLIGAATVIGAPGAVVCTPNVFAMVTAWSIVKRDPVAT
ncbi:hypothetical protein CHKEEEPN_0529 [Methylorubrum podarium]|nr:hypothetical protein CHKEEEPN_0529 [Methylorubrum podarium]